jgi:hypothetical protein
MPKRTIGRESASGTHHFVDFGASVGELSAVASLR